MGERRKAMGARRRLNSNSGGVAELTRPGADCQIVRRTAERRTKNKAAFYYTLQSLSYGAGSADRGLVFPTAVLGVHSVKSRSPAGRVRILYFATKFRPLLLTDFTVLTDMHISTK